MFFQIPSLSLWLQVMAKSKGLSWQDCKNLADLQNKLNLSLGDMADIVESCLHKEEYSKQEVCEILGVTAEKLAETSLSANTLHGIYFIFGKPVLLLVKGLQHTWFIYCHRTGTL